MRTALIAVAALAGAVGVGVLSAEPVLRKGAPDVAARLSPFDGPALTAAQDKALKAEVAARRAMPQRYSDAQLATARTAFAREPTDAGAVRQVAIIQATRGDVDGARGIMVEALRLSRRDDFATAWLIDDAARRDRVADVFRYADIALRAGRDNQRVYLPLLVQALARPGMVPLGVGVLGTSPPWTKEFFLEAAKVPMGAEHLAALRIALPRLDRTDMLDRDNGLLAALVTQGQYGSAVRLVDTLRPRVGDPANLLRDGAFGREPLYPPIEWQLVSTGELGAAIDPIRHQMVINAVADAGGAVARQTVALQPGRYRLTGALAPDAPVNPTVQVRCATASAFRPVTLVIGRQESASFAVADGECSFFTVEVSAPARAESGYDLAISRLAVTRT